MGDFERAFDATYSPEFLALAMTTTQQWLHGVGYAALSGAVGVLMSVNFDPAHFNKDSLEHIALAASIGALTGVLGYFKTSPLQQPPPALPPAASDKAGS